MWRKGWEWARVFPEGYASGMRRFVCILKNTLQTLPGGPLGSVPWREMCPVRYPAVQGDQAWGRGMEPEDGWARPMMIESC